MKKLIIFGAGEIGKYVVQATIPGLQAEFQEIYFYDNNIEKQGNVFHGYYILTSQEYRDVINQKNFSLIIATDYWHEILNECRCNGIEEQIIAIFNRYSKGNPYQLPQYSQDGEEIYLTKQFIGVEIGFYVDVGAHHPYRFSNTYWAYKRGWSGINIEPNVDALHLFEEYRKRDINLCCGISAIGDRILDYYKFEEPALNTFNLEEFRGLRKPKEIVKVPVYRLDEVLQRYQIGQIDFMSIDVEGFEMEVLQSNDWKLYRPKFVLVEQKGLTYDEVANTEIYRFLVGVGYVCDWKSLRTVIYKR